jgi:hypothetical protein
MVCGRGVREMVMEDVRAASVAKRTAMPQEILRAHSHSRNAFFALLHECGSLARNRGGINEFGAEHSRLRGRG